MTSRIRQALMIRPWEWVLLSGMVAATGVFLLGIPVWHYWTGAIFFGLQAIHQLSSAQAFPRGSLARQKMAPLLILLPAAVCSMFVLSAVEASGVSVPWATPLRFVLFGTEAVCVLLYLIVRWLIWRGRPDRAEAR